MSDSPYSNDATLETFGQMVIRASEDVPVLVDFWAAWCGPCQSLMPVLVKLADEYAGRFLLVKVNSDEQQELSTQYGVRSLPTVKVFRHGAIVDEFMGAQPESAIREIIDRYIVRASDALREQARAELASGNWESARDLLVKAVETDPQIPDNRVELAAVLAAAMQFEEAESVLDSLDRGLQDDDAVVGLRTRIHYARLAMQAPPEPELEDRLQRDGSDLEARQALAARHLSETRYREALDQFLEIMKRDRKFDDDAGHKGLLAVFRILGSDDPLVAEYRRKMASLLY